MKSMWDNIVSFVSELSNKQLLALSLFLIIAGILKNVAKGFFSAVLSVVAIFSVMYFFAPDIYTAAIEWLRQVIVRF